MKIDYKKLLNSLEEVIIQNKIEATVKQEMCEILLSALEKVKKEHEAADNPDFKQYQSEFNNHIEKRGK